MIFFEEDFFEERGFLFCIDTEVLSIFFERLFLISFVEFEITLNFNEFYIQTFLLVLEVWRFGGKGIGFTFFLTSQVFGETINKKSSNIDLVNYNFVRCNLEAFGKKVASRLGVVIKALSS